VRSQLRATSEPGSLIGNGLEIILPLDDDDRARTGRLDLRATNPVTDWTVECCMSFVNRARALQVSIPREFIDLLRRRS